MNFLLGLVLVLAVLGGIFSFVNIGGDIILGFAKQFLNENLNLELTADGVSGNPVRGYTLKNFEIKNNSGEKILSAESLYGGISFKALFKGKIKLADISVGGINMDLDQFISEIQKFKFPESDNDSNSEIPVERVSLVNSHFVSKWGHIDVSEIGVDIDGLDINIDGSVNNIPVKGVIDIEDSPEATAVNRSDINFGKGKILATGGILKEGIFDLHGSIQGLDLKELTALWPEFLKENDYDGIAGLNIDVSGTTHSPRIFGNVDYQGTKISGYPVERVSASLNYSDERLTVNNIQASAFNIPINGELSIATYPDKNPSVMIKLDGSEASLDDLDKVLKIPELKGLSGKVTSFNANISGPTNELSGLVNFSAPRIAYNGRALTNIKAQMKLAKSDTANLDGKFNFEGAQGYLQGTIASIIANQKLNLNAKIVDLDIKRVENMIPDASGYKLSGKITASVNLKGDISNPVLSGSLSSPSFSGMGNTITKPVINFTFADQKLTLQKSEGTLNGMPINVNGTIGPLPSSNPDLNINATIAVSPSALKTYVPDISQYNLKGTVNAGVKIQGKAMNPSINLLASSSNLQAMNMITAKNIEVTTALNGDLTKLDKINLSAKAGSLTASGITFSNLTAKLDKNGDKINLSNLGAKSGNGNITGSGSASVSGKDPLNFNFKFDNLALAPLAAASGIDLKGNLTGALKISGSNSNPSVAFNASVPKINAMGFALNNLAADISGTTQNLKINKLRADVEGAELSAAGTVQISPSLKTDISLKGTNINLARLLNEYPGMKDNLSGIASLNFNLTGSGQNISGKGAFSSNSIKAFGLNLANVNLPLSYSNNKFASNGGSAKLYNGTAKNNFTFDISSSKFSNQIDVNGVKLNSLLKDLVEGGLDLNGTGKLSFNVSGTGSNFSGKGTFSSNSIKAFGLNLTNVNLPLSYSGNNFSSSNGTAKVYNGNAKNNFAYDINNSKFSNQLDASGFDVNALIQDVSGGLGGGKITGSGKLNLKLNGSVAKTTSYSGSGTFSMGAGAITGFKWLDIITRIHNTNGIRYLNVSAPFTLQTGKLILKSGSIANANKNDPMYRYAKLSQNGTIDFSGQNVTMNLMTEGIINYQLINALTGGAKGGFSALLKSGGVSNLQDGLKTLLSGGMKGAEQAGSTGDFRTVSLKISGKAASPSFSQLKIGPSTLKNQNQTQAQQNVNVNTNNNSNNKSEEKFSDKIINRAVDVLIPTKNTNNNNQNKTQTQKTQTQKTQVQTQNQNQNQTKKQNVKEKVKEEITKGLKKGLGGLFK